MSSGGRQAGDPPKPCRAEGMALGKTGQKLASADLFFFFPCGSFFTGYILVENLPRPVPLALCPRAVGGAQASLVRRLARRAPPFQASPRHPSPGDRCIVPRARPAAGPRPPPPAARAPRLPAGPPCAARRPAWRTAVR